MFDLSFGTIAALAVIAILLVAVIWFNVKGGRPADRSDHIRAANDDIMQVLTRLFAAQRRVLKPSEIQRLRESKARGYHVRPTEILSDVALLNDIYARVLENEFIGDEDRPKILACVEETIVLCREMETKGDTQRFARPKEVSKSAA
ncbi:MAG: hypothetical protein AAF638_01765 [Pseudomonadota bacterium]